MFQLKRILRPITRHRRSLSIFNRLDAFENRHLGPSESEIPKMLQVTGFKTLDELVQNTIPESIKIKQETRLGRPKTESEMLERIKQVGSMNKVLKSYIGLGYYNTITPPIILRNVMENPGWYTQYTPYQPEISQGRLESLLNFQTMVCDLTGLDVANASLLDEGTAAGEAMLLAYSSVKKRNVFFVDENMFPQTIAVLETRAQGFNIQVIKGRIQDFDFYKYKDQLIGVMFQYPNMDGEVVEYEQFAKKAKDVGAYVCCATDLLALTLLKSPGEFGCDIAFGNAQRFGVPLGYGGPHAAFFAVKDSLKRKIPGRLVGLSKDVHGKPAYRLSLQTREQHIRREKATSNICTAQALLANMSAMYAVYHGPEGLKNIAQRVHNITAVLATSISAFGHQILNKTFFDTLKIELNYPVDDLMAAAVERGYNLRKISETVVALSIDETVTKKDVRELVNLFATSSRLSKFQGGDDVADVVSLQTLDHLAAASNISAEQPAAFYPQSLKRKSAYLTHEVFNTHHSETEMLRYLNKLQKKDLSLADAMIPLGSCTMKLNATVEMIPVTMPEFGAIHPFVPRDQAKGYEVLFEELEYSLSEATGFEYISLQPNSGAQGEYTGLRVIRKYLDSIGQGHRDVCLIPVSAHGTNPASAVMCGLRVVTVQCDEKGNLDLEDLKLKLKQHEGKVACTMITYPSTYGVFEEAIQEVCQLIHDAGGQVYMDGANLNAQMGLCKPAEIGADVCHLNLHKTFCIPHGGGGPGMGPIGVKSHLGPFLPSHPVTPINGESAIGPVSAAAYGSASILTISWAYLQMMGDAGLKKATQLALLNANYMMYRLKDHYKVLFTNENGMCAHEFIIDIRPFGKFGVEAIDIAKRLHDYGFHSPTMAFPVPGTLMIEPTESEPLNEIDRFCDAMIQIREEIREIEQGKYPQNDNVLTNAPHTIETLVGDKWDKPYSREKAAFPMKGLRAAKFWPTVGRVDDTYGDRNLICSCPPMSSYE